MPHFERVLESESTLPRIGQERGEERGEKAPLPLRLVFWWLRASSRLNWGCGGRGGEGGGDMLPLWTCMLERTQFSLSLSFVSCFPQPFLLCFSHSTSLTLSVSLSLSLSTFVSLALYLHLSPSSVSASCSAPNPWFSQTL